MDECYPAVEEEFGDDDGTGAPSAADIFFYITFIIALAAVISRQGFYAPGL